MGSPVCPNVLASSWAKTCSQGPKMKFFRKGKKHPQVFTQGASVPNFSQIRPFLSSPGCLENFRTHRHTLSDSSSTEVENFYMLLYFVKCQSENKSINRVSFIGYTVRSSSNFKTVFFPYKLFTIKLISHF